MLPGILLVPGANLLVARIHIGFKQLRPDQALLLLFIEEMNAGGVDVEAALNAAAAGGRHPAPVFKRVGDQRPGRNGGDGVVPVAYLDRGEADIDHRAVGAVLRHLQPVAKLEHIVGRELDTGHQTKDRIFKYQHQYRGHRAEPANQDRWRLAYQQGNNQDTDNNRRHQLNSLEYPLQR